MNEATGTYWPEHLPKKISYRYGQIPLHEYVQKNAENTPEQVAYNFYGNILTWREVNNFINRLAQFLKERNVKKGDRIALYLQNCPQYIIGYYAIQRIGGVVVPLNPMFKEVELAYSFQEGEIKGVIASQDLYFRIENIKHETDKLEFSIVTNYRDFLPKKPALSFPDEFLSSKDSHTTAYDLTEIIKNTQPLQTFEKINLLEDVALLVFTSGTTGRPKGAMLTHGNTLFKTAANAQANNISIGDRSLSVAPFSHIAGMLMGVNISVYCALETYILTKFEPQTVVETIETYEIKMWYSIALMNAAILMLPHIKTRNLSSLKVNMATSFGISVTEKLANQWHEVTNDCLLFEASYGLSESHTGDTFMPQNKIKYGSCGIPVYETEIKIIDEFGNEVEPEEQGEIIIKGPGVFKGYFKRPQETKEVLKNDWLYTGDIGKVDKDGYLYYLGRTKEMIKSSGYSVFPDDVEAILNTHPAIAQCVVIGVPDSKRGESVKAFIVLKTEHKNKIKETNIIEWSKENMAAYKYPRYVQFLEQLPTTSTGKVLRRLLKEESLN